MEKTARKAFLRLGMENTADRLATHFPSAGKVDRNELSDDVDFQ
jgi:uncharacterized membrane protein